MATRLRASSNPRIAYIIMIRNRTKFWIIFGLFVCYLTPGTVFRLERKMAKPIPGYAIVKKQDNALKAPWDLGAMSHSLMPMHGIFVCVTAVGWNDCSSVLVDLDTKTIRNLDEDWSDSKDEITILQSRRLTDFEYNEIIVLANKDWNPAPLPESSLKKWADSFCSETLFDGAIARYVSSTDCSGSVLVGIIQNLASNISNGSN